MRHGPTRNHTREDVNRPEGFGSVTRPEAEQDFALGAIAVDHARSARRIGKRHIGVRSEQIQGIAGQSGRVMLRSPVEDVQRNWSAHQAASSVLAKPYT